MSGSLPVSTSVKMIEIWMLFSLLLTFADVLLQTYIHHLRERRLSGEDKEEEEMQEVRQKLRAYLFPFSTLVVNTKR